MRIVMLLVLASLIMLAGCGLSAETSTPDEIGTLAPVPAEYAGKSNPLGAEAVVTGAEVFQTNCVMCHGPEGHGDGPAGASLQPRPKNLAVLNESASDDYLFWRISEGKVGTTMLAWKSVLTEDEIWQAVSFIRSLK